MFILKVRGARNSTLAYHQLDSMVELREMIAIYEALGHKPEAFEIEERQVEQAA
jgi:hypothetical protein